MESNKPNAFLSGAVILSGILAAWCWMIDIPGTKGIVQDWKKIRFEQQWHVDTRISDMQKRIDHLAEQLKSLDYIVSHPTPAKEIMPACFVGQKTSYP